MMKDKLIHDQQLLKKQKDWLEISFKQCKDIGLKESYTVDEFGYFETLCSRYSRGIDFLIRKIFRSIDEYEFENQGTLVDVVNNAHKRSLFDDIDKIRLMKDVRNTIVHEYIEDNLSDVFEEVIQYTEDLLKIMNNTLNYIKKNL